MYGCSCSTPSICCSSNRWRNRNRKQGSVGSGEYRRLFRPRAQTQLVYSKKKQEEPGFPKLQVPQSLASAHVSPSEQRTDPVGGTAGGKRRCPSLQGAGWNLDSAQCGGGSVEFKLRTMMAASVSVFLTGTSNTEPKPAARSMATRAGGRRHGPVHSAHRRFR
jgi:hypothetical protein